MMWVFMVSALFTVNAPGDGHDTSPGDGVCDAGGFCTLRAAIEETNALNGPDTVAFDPGITTVTLDAALGTLTASDTLVIQASADTLNCGNLTGATCLHLGAPATLSGLTILNGDFPLFVKSTTAELRQVTLQASHTALQAESASVIILQSRLTGQQSALRSDSSSLVIRQSRLESSTSTVLVWRNLRSTPTPLDTLDQDTLIASGTTCLHVEGALKRGIVQNSVFSCGGYGIYMIPSGYSPESLTVRADSFHITGSNLAIYGSGGRAHRFENLRFTTPAGGRAGFMILEDTRRVLILNNLVQDAGHGNLVELHNVDSSRVEGNRFLFSTFTDSVGGVVLSRGSEVDTLQDNRYTNMKWAGVAVFDSSSSIVIVGDSLAHTGGIALRPDWTGRYWPPFYVPSSPPTLGKHFLIRKVEVTGTQPLAVIGLDSVRVDSSVFRLTKTWGIGAFVAGAFVEFDHDTFYSVTDAGGGGTGHAIGVEWFYGDSDDASTASDDRAGRVQIRSSHFQDFRGALRFVDIDTSMVQADTLWNGKNNTTANLAIISERFFLTLVQVFNNACNLLPGVDSVRLSSSFYNRILSKRKDDEGLFAFHYESSPSTHYDSLELWTLTPVEIWDGNNPSQWVSDYTITLYGGSITEPHTITLTYGLANMLDPCPSAGRPKSVSGRWMVMKVKSNYATDVDEIPADRPLWTYTLAPGKLLLETRIPLRVVDPAGRLRLRLAKGKGVLQERGVFWIIGPEARRKVVIP